MLLVWLAIIAPALALTDEKLAEYDAAITNNAARLQATGDSGDPTHKALLQDLVDRATTIARAERRKRSMVGEHVVVASFDSQMQMLEGQYAAAVQLLKNYEASHAGTNTDHVVNSKPPPLPADLR